MPAKPSARPKAPAPLPSAALPPPSSTRPLLARAIRLLEEGGPLRVNFDDLSGITLDYPELALPAPNDRHACAFCTFAKQFPDDRLSGAHTDCSLNKRATNEIALRRAKGFEGLCHLGVFDIVEPLVYHGGVLGVFYYGQVAIREWKAASLARIARYCRRRGLAPGPFRAAYERLPVLSLAEAEPHRERLKTVVAMIALCCEALALPTERYHSGPLAVRWRDFEVMPVLIRQVEAYVYRHLDQPCRVIDLARHFRCNANYLGATFKKCMGCEIGDYVNLIRVKRAKRLLPSPRLSIGEVAYKCGFTDPSYFGKVFRRITSQTPAQFRAASRGGAIVEIP
ncbi:PocR sensory domain-containing protein [Verrucomicrobium sp. GAS474]|uniref:helix-turn-helix domain-containing protein n=1 Tax=Verrucomicrobium sp. GAS474 TaxID=1882831 RepID=UPI00087C47CB|nr:helix-turn-helix domain-containing protein [Verrucomicrobium sp. GAS474]SDT92049.1 PocR sensory domain-containing protein [Verrucomicrobium sp. GAS474]